MVSKVIAKMQITPIANSSKADVKIEMPIWLRKSSGKIYIKLPLFGGLDTFANSEEEIDLCISEALKIFFSAAKTHGAGIRKELEALGWQSKSAHNIRFKDRKNKFGVPSGSFKVEPKMPIFQNMMGTGTTRSLSMAI